MEESVLKLKKLNAAYIAALEYDRCPDNAEAVAGLFEIPLQDEHLKEALEENQGRRPDEIALSISYAINDL